MFPSLACSAHTAETMAGSARSHLAPLFSTIRMRWSAISARHIWVTASCRSAGCAPAIRTRASAWAASVCR